MTKRMPGLKVGSLLYYEYQSNETHSGVLPRTPRPDIILKIFFLEFILQDLVIQHPHYRLFSYRGHKLLLLEWFIQSQCSPSSLHQIYCNHHKFQLEWTELKNCTMLLASIVFASLDWRVCLPWSEFCMPLENNIGLVSAEASHMLHNLM